MARSIAIALGSITIFCAALAGCGSADPTVATNDSADLTAATTGSESLFDSSLTAGNLTAAHTRTLFHTSHAILGNFVLGMRKRTCTGAVCGDWAADTKPVFVIPDLVAEDYVDLTLGRVSGSPFIDFTTVNTKKNMPVIQGNGTGDGAPPWGVEYWLSFSMLPAAGTFSFNYEQPLSTGTSKLITLAEFTQSALSNERMIARTGTYSAAMDQGQHEERQFALYARVNRAETVTLMADGPTLDAEW